MQLDWFDLIGSGATLVLVFLSVFAGLSYFRSSSQATDLPRHREDEERLRRLGARG